MGKDCAGFFQRFLQGFLQGFFQRFLQGFFQGFLQGLVRLGFNGLDWLVRFNGLIDFGFKRLDRFQRLDRFMMESMFLHGRFDGFTGLNLSNRFWAFLNFSSPTKDGR